MINFIDIFVGRVTSTQSSATGTETTPSTNGLTRSRELSRRRQTVTPPSTTATNVNTRASAVLEDHNYGEPGPSTLRQSRRIVTLSRHQRNPDELDIPISSDIPSTPLVDPLNVPDNTSISGRLRHRTTIVNNTVRNESDEDLSDPEDNKPLHSLMVGSSSSTQSMRGRPRTVVQSPNVTMSARSARSQKRPYYNEDSDDSINNQQPQGNYQKTPNSSLSIHSSKRRMLSTRIDYNEDDTNSENSDGDDADDEKQVSVSSRGRVRKISSKVRGYFRE